MYKTKYEHLAEIEEKLHMEWDEEFTTMYRENKEQGFPKKSFELDNEKMRDLREKIVIIEDLRMETLHREAIGTPDEEELP